MKALSFLYRLTKADLLERIRRRVFIVMLALSLYLAYLFVPDRHAGYITVSMGHYRGIYNSAWIGAMFGMMAAAFLSLIGFYLVRGSVSRDIQSGVGQMLAASPLNRFWYLMSKALSNLATLAAVLAVLFIGAIGMQLVRGEDLSIHVWQLLAPMLFIVVPVMAVVSAVAVLFESVSFLRRTLGNVLFFFLWTTVLAIQVPKTDAVKTGETYSGTDMMGMAAVVSSMQDAALRVFPSYQGGFSIGFQILPDRSDPATFVWDGVNWPAGVILSRMAWLGIAFLIVLGATALFRFTEWAPAMPAGPPIRKKESDAPSAAPAVSQLAVHRLTPLTCQPGLAYWPMIIAEARLMFKSVGRWWYAGALVFMVLELALPLNGARLWAWPLAWIWPLPLWSAMGSRERYYGTDQLMRSSQHPLARQLPALWLAGLFVAMVSGFGIGLRSLLSADLSGFASWGVGVCFIPSMALAMGIWTGGTTLFEISYTLLWYIGPLNRFPALDYMGVTKGLGFQPSTSVFMTLALILIVAAWAGRYRQLRQ